MSAEAHDYDESDAEYDLPPTVPPAPPEPRAVVAHAGRYAAGAIVAGKYQLVSVLGEGGMGSVWVAKNRTLDVDVALKLMRAELADEVDGVAERMLQEARAAASIGHPAIVQVFDFGFSELGDPFIVMELLRGESLSELLRRRGRLRATRAVQTLLPIVDALGAAHATGIVHRDMKPENVFLARLGGNRIKPKVLDFGIAKLEQRANERLTRSGAVIGSPAYMAPEQLRGDPGVDARADVWALSVVLYQMLTGRRPFEGESYHSSMWKVLNAAPRPLSEHGVEEPELWSIIETGLAKAAEQRFLDTRAFGRKLAEWLLERGVQEDITDASLRGWLKEASELEAQGHSFFPSEEPSLRKPAEETKPRVFDVVESSGTRRIDARIEPERASRRAPLTALLEKRWLALTLLSAFLAFLGAAVCAAWANSTPTMEEDEPRRERSRRVATPAPTPTRAAPREPRVTADSEPEVVAAPEPAPTIEPRSYAAPRRAGASRAAARRPAARLELKDPFQK